MMHEIFFEKGERLELSTNYRLSLHEKGYVWYLEKGSMILFAILKKGEAEGRRTLLSTIHSGKMLFDMEKEEGLSYEIFAFSEEPVILWKLSANTLKTSLRTFDEKQKMFAFLLEHWLSQLASFMIFPIEIKPKHWIIQGGDLRLNEGETFTAKISEVPSEKERVFWLLPKQGDFKLLGPQELKVSQFFPVLPHFYFLMLRPGQLNVKTTQETIRDETWTIGLDYFHKFLGRFFLKKQKRLDQDELQCFVNYALFY